MKDRPILFSGVNVLAILEGRKTQTRRVIKPQPPLAEWGISKPWETSAFEVGKPFSSGGAKTYKCPYGQPGDRLWVRETWATSPFYGGTPRDIDPSDPEVRIVYRADIPKNDSRQSHYVWRPSIFLPRWASRILLEVVNVRVERVQDISNLDVVAEGVDISGLDPVEMRNPFLNRYAKLWNSINANRGYSWEANPWVWVVEFKKV